MPNKRKINTLYIEQNTDGTVGGSHFSLLYLIEGIDKNKYNPISLFYQDNYLIPSYREAGAKVLFLKKRFPINLNDFFQWIPKRKKFKSIFLFLEYICLIIQKTVNYIHTFIIPAFKCWNIIRKEKIDLIHLNNTFLRPQQWILASIFTNAKIIAHERGINNFFPFQTRFWARYLKGIICISDAVKYNLLNHGFPENQLIRIYNGLDPKRFSCTKSKNETQKYLGIETDCPVVGIVGNIKEWKGQETVIKAIKLIRSKFQNIKCLIIGGVSNNDKYYLRHLEKVVEIENLEKNIIFTGRRKDIPDMINALDVLIHASIHPEPFGRVLLEGMALRKPIISTNIGASLEILVDGKTGILIPPGDEKKLSEAIIYLLNNEIVAVKMGKAGHKRLCNYFHISDYIKKIEELYIKIIFLE